MVLGLLLAVSPMQRFWLLLSLKLCYHKSGKSNFYHLWLSPSFRYSYNTIEDCHGVILNSLHLVDFREDLSSTHLGFPTSHVWIFSSVFFCLFILRLGQNQFCFICSLKSVILFKWEFFLLLSVKYSSVFGVVAVLFWLQHLYPSLGEPGVG